MVPAFTPADVEQWLKPARANLPLPSLIVMPPQWASFLGCGPDYIERFSVVESTILHDVADRNGVADVFQRISLQHHQVSQLTWLQTANVPRISQSPRPAYRGCLQRFMRRQTAISQCPKVPVVPQPHEIAVTAHTHSTTSPGDGPRGFGPGLGVALFGRAPVAGVLPSRSENGRVKSEEHTSELQ